MMTKAEFLSQLRVELEGHPMRDEIVAEYTDYIEQKHRDLLLQGNNELQAEALVMSQLVDPKKIVAQFSSGRLKTKPILRKVLLVNYSLFFLGILITMAQSTVVSHLWFYLVEQKWVILGAYSLLWGCIGYLIGKKYGFKGKKLHKRIFQFSLIPNYLFMLIVLYMEPIQQWFQPLLTPGFVVMCIVVTLFFYPMSKVSFKMGVFKGI